jgi:DNA modification methylase
VKPYYEDDLVAIYHGDMRDIVTVSNVEAWKRNPWGDGMIVTDPPYGIGLDYGDTADTWRPDRNTWGQLHLIGDSLHMTVSNRHLDYWLAETTAANWEYLHTSVYWNDTRAGGNWNGQFAYAWEPLLSFKRKGESFKLGKRMMTDVFQHDGRKDTPHPAERNLGMWRTFIDLLPDGLIVDPFMGSGTTLRACRDLGRPAVGIEREEKWCELAANRCAQLELGV